MSKGGLCYVIFKSNERSEDSYISLADFFSGKVLKVSNNYRCAFIHIDAFVNALRFICFLSSIEVHLMEVT